jgi:hypothetical protein
MDSSSVSISCRQLQLFQPSLMDSSSGVEVMLATIADPTLVDGLLLWRQCHAELIQPSLMDLTAPRPGRQLQLSPEFSPTEQPLFIQCSNFSTTIPKSAFNMKSGVNAVFWFRHSLSNIPALKESINTRRVHFTINAWLG